MIKLTVRSTSESKITQFDQPIVIIGSNEADLPLPEKDLQKQHITIIEEEHRFIVINSANDPFATLNTLPFGKRVLTNQDVIQIGETKVVFEGEHLPPVDIEALFQELKEITALTNGIQAAREADAEITSDNLRPSKMLPTQAFQEEVVIPQDLEFAQENALNSLNETSQENVSNAPSEIPLEGATNAAMALSSDPVSPEMAIEDPFKETDSLGDITKDLNEDPENRTNEKEVHESEALNLAPQSNWRLYLALFIAFSTLMSLVSTVLYFKVVHESDGERIKAAEAVADVGMALAYAQVHHIKPQKQNWSDPDFLKNNLASVLSSEYPAFSHIDKQGQLANCAYILRIYTSSDLSHFIVIAQPEPTLLQWLIPKASIIMDSDAMEMRHINDLKALNRLLVNPNAFDGANAVEISTLVEQGELIPLASLAKTQENQGFIPPKLLALSHPGAENLVYNAPRYYHFGESVINRAVHSFDTDNDEHEHEAARLREEIEALSKYLDIVLYSSQGIQKAIQAQKALAAFAPQSKFITGYLNFNTEGVMTGSHLVYNDNQMTVYGPPSRIGLSDTEVAFLSNEEDFAANDRSTSSEFRYQDKHEAHTVQTDLNHSLLLRLTSLANDRRQSLTTVSERINALLNSNDNRSLDGFSALLSNLVSQYEKIDVRYQNKIMKELIALYEEYPELSLLQFIAYLKMAGLEQYYKPIQ